MEKRDMKYWETFFDNWKSLLEREFELQQEMNQLEEQKKQLTDSLRGLTLHDVTMLKEIFVKNRKFILFD